MLFATATALGLGVAPGCSPNPTPIASAASPAKQQVDELVQALTPIAGDLTSDLRDRHFHRGEELKAKAMAGPREVGLAALERLRQGAPLGDDQLPIQEIERGLLAVGAHAAPDDARPLLENLVLQYWPSLSLRTEALICLADTSPARALEILEPWVTKAKLNQTTPPAEFIVKAWVAACEKTGRSPVPELADIATNLFYDQTGRVRAVKTLGRYKDPLATQALSAILIESTGDGYLRRMAAQGLRDTLPTETACDIFRKVADREADQNLLLFLLDLLEKSCGR
ncbi:MAG: hypothetical protein IPJ77_21145 [Planctomycetes bacterium]|nr:hypothetical protein [Planctomycetota bacterium]